MYQGPLRGYLRAHNNAKGIDKLVPYLRIRTVAACLTAMAMTANAFGVISTFDTDFDGWTQTTGISWQGAGGNPGGHLMFNDFGPANGGQLFAPTSFHGDWLSLYGVGGSFSLDYQLKTTLFDAFPSWVKITGSGGVIGRNFPVFSSPTGWVNINIGLAQPNWAVLGGTWSGCLSDVTEVLIFMSASSTSDEVTCVDNIQVVPEPGSIAALTYGTAMILGRRRRRQRSVQA